MCVSQQTLVIMAKKPVCGAVKTRLGAQIGMARATGFYRNLLFATLRRLARDRRWQTVLAVSPQTVLGDPIWPKNVNQIAQTTGNLGVRMQALLEAFPTGPVVIVGSDIPAITAAYIADAFRQLRRNDLVFGAAGDGGYWLVGARRGRKVRGIFNNVRWSGPHALSDTLANAAGFTIGQAATLTDIDTARDYRHWRRTC